MWLVPLMYSLTNRRRSVCVLYACMDVGVLVSGCGCSLLSRTSFQFEVRMQLGTGLKLV